MKQSSPLLWCLWVALAFAPATSQAWWNKQWHQRTVVTVNTTAAGVAIHENVAAMAVPVRLHSGNFDFVGARPDGADLRMVAADDATPLPFWIERYDAVNELALLWVQVPQLLAGSDRNVIYAYAGNDRATAAASAAPVFDSGMLAVFQFAEQDGIPVDHRGRFRASAAVPHEVNGLLGQSLRLSGAAILITGDARTAAAVGTPATVAFWIRPDVAAGTPFQQGDLRVTLDGGAVTAAVGDAVLRGAQVPVGIWTQLVVTREPGGRVTLFVNGAQVAQAMVPARLGATSPEPIRLGDGCQGLMDELELAATARSNAWVGLAYAAQSADARLIATATESLDAAAGGASQSTTYYAILFRNLTADAWVIIGILALILLVALVVMADKALYVNRTESANRAFLLRFHGAADVLGLEEVPVADRRDDSCLYRLYRAALRELGRYAAGGPERPLTAATVDALRAAVDANAVREGYLLNARMVLLTIAIAGGPFIGLLGTVTGVMITFASIAAAGDVNVNAIAPGIAAALLATVAGLAVAIPSLFGYNYLTARIRRITSDMQIFGDELVTRIVVAREAR